MDSSRRTVLGTAAAAAAAAALAPDKLLARHLKRVTFPGTSIGGLIDLNFDDVRPGDLNAKQNGQYLFPNLRMLYSTGVTFSDHHTPWSFCASSRVSSWTGLYQHGVTSNVSAYQDFVSLGLEQDSLPAHAKAAGIFTGIVGKEVNNYGDGPNDVFPAECFDFGAICWKTFERYYAPFTLMENGTLVAYNNNEYIADVHGQRCIDFLNLALQSGKPFYLSYWPNASHGPNVPKNNYVGLVNPSTMPEASSFNVSISGGPQHPKFDAATILGLQQKWALRLETIKSVDDNLGVILQWLSANGLLSSTVIRVGSDNSFILGEHGIADAKDTPFAVSTRVPCLFWNPSFVASTISRTVSAVDVAATIADIMGVLPGWTVTGKPIDGQSFLPLLYGQSLNNFGRAKMIQSTGPDGIDYGIVTQNWSVLHPASGQYKYLFDNKNDPDQNINWYGSMVEPYATAQSELEADLIQLQNCSGSTCNIAHTYVAPPNKKKHA